MSTFKNKISIFKICLALVASASFSSASALQAFAGKVTSLEPSYLPGTVAFTMSTGNSTCPAGTWIFWANADTSNNKAVYATLLVAFSTGKRVNFFMNDGDSTCVGRHLHIIED